MGNLAWVDIQSAPATETLLETGTSIVGKPKTARFTNNDRPTAVMMPSTLVETGTRILERRALGPGPPLARMNGSMPRSGLTLGSIRTPAFKNGIFGLRPFFDSLSTDGYHTRDLYLFRSFEEKWIGDKYSHYPSFPQTWYVPNLLLSTLCLPG
ncbi:hypothetical protein DFH07DRAFT_961205 [Mycena maculata]|uniref:Uncharacterized protein n=1 Tax=Mycena maculata TaxID=230809 RepID=A0AAD7N9J6_9AGAR|nr:hypothetical protein DFH07DRAFT_961205 [Mycena maculata]